MSRPSLTFTPVALIDALVEPSFAEMTIFAVDVLTLFLPPLASPSLALALPPQAVRVRAPTIRTAQAPTVRRIAMSAVVTGCSSFV